MTELIYPLNGQEVTLHTQVQSEFIRKIKSDGTDAAIEWLREHKNEQEGSFPVPIKFLWRTTAEASVFEISENADFHNARMYSTKEMSWELENLKIGKQYFWRVNGGTPFVFKTENIFPRFIRINGAINIRDLGGVLIRQGIVFRGSALNGEYTITDEGRYTFCDELGIKTQLDLRLEHFGKLSESPAGELVQLKQIPYRPYKELFEPKYKVAIREIMEIFAEEANYPIYFHCAGGADRTGMIAMFLRAIAGEKDEDIHLDYELTSLSLYKQAYNTNGLRYRTAEYYVEMLNMFKVYAPEKTLTEQIICFLDSCGVTETCRKRIRDILVEVHT